MERLRSFAFSTHFIKLIIDDNFSDTRRVKINISDKNKEKLKGKIENKADIFFKDKKILDNETDSDDLVALIYWCGLKEENRSKVISELKTDPTVVKKYWILFIVI